MFRHVGSYCSAWPGWGVMHHVILQFGMLEKGRQVGERGLSEEKYFGKRRSSRRAGGCHRATVGRALKCTANVDSFERSSDDCAFGRLHLLCVMKR